MAKYFGVGDDVPFQVYITPLDNRETTGEWVSFPTTPENLRDVFARMEIGPSDWSIANVEAHIYGIRDVIWHCDSLDELNYLAAKLEELDEDSIGVYQSVIEIDEHCDTVAELINLTGNLHKLIHRRFFQCICNFLFISLCNCTGFNRSINIIRLSIFLCHFNNLAELAA